MEIFKIFGSIFLKSEDVDKKLDAVDKKAGGVGLTFGQMIGTAAKVGAAIGAAAVVAGGALFTLAKNTSDAASEINDMSERTGLNTDRLQELKYATGQVGVEFSSLTTATKGLTNYLADAAAGGKKQAEVFEKLKVSTKNADGSLRNMDDIFPEILNKLADMKNETERNALANDIFGKSANELVPLLNQGSEGIKQMSDRAHELGGVMDKDAIAAGDKFGDTLDELKTASGGVFAAVGSSLIPIMQKLADWIIKHMPEIRKTIDDVLNKFVIPTVDGFAKAISFVTDNANILLPLIGTLGGAFLAYEVITKAVKIATTAWTAVQWLLNAALTANPIGIVVVAVGALVGAIIYLWNTNEDFRNALISAWEAIKKVANSVFDGIKSAVETVIGAVNGVIDTVKDALRSIGILNDTEVQDKSYTVTEIHKSIDSSSAGTGGGFSGGTSSGGGGKGSSGGFASGTNDASPGWHMVGERGPELVEFRGGERVIPNDKLGKSGIVVNVNNPILLDQRMADKLGGILVNKLRSLGVSPA